MLFTWLCLLTLPVLASGVKQVRTSGGNANEALCVFPFIYKGTSYSECTRVDSNQLWCATTNSYDKDEVWGNCVTVKQVRTSGGNANEALCVFPFIYKGTSYNECTRVDSNQLWCATTNSYDKDAVWGNCVTAKQVKTSGGNANEALCVFPFIYEGTSYNECTRVGSNQLWCATTNSFDEDGVWGYCDIITYGSWSAWTMCSLSCGGGRQTRVRTCIGTDCSRLGVGQQSRVCSTKPCEINGGYGGWSEWTPCSITCGDGEATRTRRCNNPTPQHGGADCSVLGAAEETQVCRTNPCVVDGGYSRWSPYSHCSCDGKTTRRRTCTNPRPENGGQDCTRLGGDEETRDCPDKPSCATCYSEVLETFIQQNARKCYPSLGNAYFVGYGGAANFSDEVFFEKMGTVYNCIAQCYAWRQKEGNEWGSAVYNVKHGYCHCQTKSTHELEPCPSSFYYKFTS